MTWTFDPVAGPFEFTEGPAWTGGAVLFSDIPTGRVLRYDPDGGEVDVWRTDTAGANGLKFGPDGYLYACEGAGRRVARYEADRSRTVIADAYEGTPLNRPNDLAFDDDGRCWFTDPIYADGVESHLGHESVYRADPPSSDGEGDGDPDDGSDEARARHAGWTLHRMTEDTTKPNGVLVAPGGDRLYVAQSDYDEDAPTELRAYPIREDGSLGDYAVLHDFHPDRGVDGMALDAEGNLVACAGWPDGGPGPSVYVFAPDGETLARHPYPGDQPTNCAFGGPDLRTLYVTGDGRLYRVETDRTGHLGAPAVDRYD